MKSIHSAWRSSLIFQLDMQSWPGLIKNLKFSCLQTITQLKCRPIRLFGYDKLGEILGFEEKLFYSVFWLKVHFKRQRCTNFCIVFPHKRATLQMHTGCLEAIFPHNWVHIHAFPQLVSIYMIGSKFGVARFSCSKAFTCIYIHVQWLI